MSVTTDYFRTEAPSFARSCEALRKAVASMDPKDAHAVKVARARLVDCRLHYKRIEFFLEYFFRYSSRLYNSPPKFEAEEPDMEYQSPAGLQVIEELLFEKKTEDKNHPDKNSSLQNSELVEQATAVAASAADLSTLLYDFKASDAQVLESLRLELIRVMSLGITGYDAPLLQSGINESYEALCSLRHQLQPYLVTGEMRSDSLRACLDKAIGYLQDNPAFAFFDRLTFLTGSALPLQRQLGRLIRDRDLELNTNGVLNYHADNLFSRDALIPEAFPHAEAKASSPGVSSAPDPGDNPTLVRLGRILFSEKALSGNGSRSCATCHSPAKMFTDRLPVSLAMDGHSPLQRNAPSLLYSGFQYSQFWDGRAVTLEDQVRAVLRDPREMNADTMVLLRRLKRRPEYSYFFREANKTAKVADAIAAYVRSLHPRNSPFDRYMEGDRGALNARERNGANLFMGKAQCATCHFMPLFNGLIPPDYKLTEFEVAGTTATDDFRPSRLRLSKDPGRFRVYPFPFYKGAFKTPTVRNVALTWPYMHNGAFHSLEKVMEFYNKGGGAGMGLKFPGQTLSPDPLHLSQREIGDIIYFMRALTDSLPTSLVHRQSANP